MHRLLCSALLLFLLCCAYGCAAAAVVKPLPEKGQGPWDAYTVAVAPGKQKDPKDPKTQKNTRSPVAKIQKDAVGWGPLRIHVIPRGVAIWKQYCERNQNTEHPFGDRKTFNLDRDAFCNRKTGITPEKALNMYKVAAYAVYLHHTRLSVKRVIGNLTLDKNGGKDFKEKCPDAFARSEHLSMGIANTDFALFVSLTRSYEDPRICSKGEDKRPISGLIKLNPNGFKDARHYIRVTAHEIGHVLGFYLEEFKENNLFHEYTKYGKTMGSLKTETLTEKAKTHYGCQIINTMELESYKDKNDLSWKTYPHWSRRIAKDDLMSAYFDRPSGMYYTALTLAVFDSMPFYRANFSRAEPMTWGRNAGCGFLHEKCVERYSPKFSDMFCNEQTSVLRCTTDRLSLGKCSMKELESIPEEFQYFRNKRHGSPYEDRMDYCPVIEPTFETSCELGDENKMPGSIVSNTSRCLKVKSLHLVKKKDNGKVEDICAKVKCENGILKVRYKGNKKWHECTDEGFIDIEKGPVFVGGRIVCPKYTDFCRSESGPKPKPKRRKTRSVSTVNNPSAAATPLQTNSQSSTAEAHEGNQGHDVPKAERQHGGPEVSATGVNVEQQVQTEFQSTAMGDLEEQYLQENEEEEEEVSENDEEMVFLGLEEHGGSDDKSGVETVFEGFNTDEYTKNDVQLILEELVNGTMNSKSGDVDSTDSQGKQGGRKRRFLSHVYGTDNTSSGARIIAGMTANGHIILGSIVGLTEDEVTQVLNNARAMEDKSIYSSIASSYIAPLTLLVCVVAAALVAP